MKSVFTHSNFYILLVILITSCVSGSFTRPDSPMCIGLDNGTLFCKDSTQEWVQENVTNFICTTPDGYDMLEERNNCLEKELLKCYKNPKKCKSSGGLCGYKPKQIQKRIREN